MTEETTADQERHISPALLAALEQCLLHARWDTTVRALEQIESQVDELLTEVEEWEDEVRELKVIFQNAGMPEGVIEEVLTEDNEAAVDGLVVLLSSLLGQWRGLYLDIEKMVGHLVLDHGYSGVISTSRFHELIADHTALHHGRRE